MLVKQFFESRIADIVSAIEKSVIAHGGLMGQLAEAKWMLVQFLAKELADKAEADTEKADAIQK